MTVEAPEYLDDDARAAAGGVLAAARAVDGSAPFSEEVRLRWRAGLRPEAGEWHLLARDAAGAVCGYAHAAPSGVAELAVHPRRRRQGHGGALLAALGSLAGEQLRVWSHGDVPAAREVAARRGLRVVRELVRLSRELAEAPAAGPLPAGVRLRDFRPGADDAAWLALNARAFATHPEQGAWAARDLAERQAQPWFDPAGLLLAERDGQLVGFHWTKIEGGVGEVFVLGVDPAAQGDGLGRALTVAGLRHLHTRGVRAVTLYADADNAAALAVYERLEFRRVSADVMYAQ